MRRKVQNRSPRYIIVAKGFAARSSPALRVSPTNIGIFQGERYPRKSP